MVSGMPGHTQRKETKMEHTHSGSQRARPTGVAANAARMALEIVVGVLLVDREPYSSEYEDVFHMHW